MTDTQPNDLSLWDGEPSGNIPLGFFAYPSSPPMLPPTIRAGIESINKTNQATIVGWEDLSINGRFIIGEIKKAIDDCDFVCADLTGINPNVLFEIGYAIARNKRIWLIRDGTYTDARKDFDQLRLLTTIGYTPYTNSSHIITNFFKDRPDADTGNTIFNRSINETLGPQSNTPNLLYLKSLHDTEASVYVTRAIEDSGIPTTLNDPKESSLQPLNWYTEKLWSSAGCIVHFVSPSREGFRIHNARYALIAGLSVGLDIPTLMLTEHSEMLAPIDYRDLLGVYTTPSEAGKLTKDWLVPIAVDSESTAISASAQISALRLATALKDFHVQLGDWIAENEKNSLEEYFVETTVSLDIANGTQNVFVGRKGTGKTANLLHAATETSADPTKLVCLMKPVGYEIEGLVRLFKQYKLRDMKGYVIESLWKYMLYTEVAFAAHKQINESALWQMTNQDVRDFVELFEDERNAFSGDFTVRLERIVASLEGLQEGESNQQFRSGVSEALHSGALARLRTALSKVLSGKSKVLLLIDNLDKPWRETADLAELAEFISGLLIATTRLTDQLNRGDKDRSPVRFDSAIFLRSDIFERVLSVTLEPDKLAYVRLKWDDPEMLIRIIEERYIASHGPTSDPANMWKKYFCSEVRGLPAREYLTSRILQRPRDIIYLVKAAVSFAVNRRRDRVEEKDILDGEKTYSQYALDSILVENVSAIPLLEQILFEFVGSPSVITEDRVSKFISAVGMGHMTQEVITQLISLSFLGVEIREDIFIYSEEARELKKNRVLSQRYMEAHEAPRRFEINKPFRAYLEITESSSHRP